MPVYRLAARQSGGSCRAGAVCLPIASWPISTPILHREAAIDANELTDRERAILAFVRRHFEQNNMRLALRMLDSARIDDIRQIINGYRGLYEREVRH